MHAVRIMLKKRAMAGANGYCARFNTTGIPCYPCKFSPCEEWDELMETMLSNTIYKEMSDAVRRAVGRHPPKPGHRGGRGKGGGKGGGKAKAAEAAAGGGDGDDDDEMDGDGDDW